MITKEQLIEMLIASDTPNDSPLILFDFRMNASHADPEGTREGIYHQFGVGKETLYRSGSDGCIDMNQPYEVTTISFENDVDYDKDGNRIQD